MFSFNIFIALQNEGAVANLIVFLVFSNPFALFPVTVIKRVSDTRKTKLKIQLLIERLKNQFRRTLSVFNETRKRLKNNLAC